MIESERYLPFMKGYSVINCDQIDNLPAQFHPAPVERPETALNRQFLTP